MHEIEDRSLAFPKDWAKAKSENADVKPFWFAFFIIFYNIYMPAKKSGKVKSE